MKAERRSDTRKIVEPIHVLDLTLMDSYSIIATQGMIVDASSTGFLIHVDRRDLGPEELRQNLTLEPLHSARVVLYVPQMNLDMDGTITRTKLVGHGYFEIAVDFSDDIPKYWRECLVDLLPTPGEFEDEL